MPDNAPPLLQTPDYYGGSIVNLMSSIVDGLGGDATGAAPLRLLAPDRVAAARNVVLLVIDGLGYRQLSGSPAGNAFREHLAGSITSVFPTTTTSAITTFLTGLAPQQHGLTGWYTWFRELGSVLAVLPFQTRAGAADMQAAGIDARAFFQLRPLPDRVAAPCWQVLPARIAHSAYNLAHSGRAQIQTYRRLGGMCDKITAIAQQPEPEKFIYAYWPRLDTLSHQHGSASKRAEKHLGELDDAFAALLQSLRGTGTLLLVTADHGFIDTTAETRLSLNDYPAIRDTLCLPLCGEPRVAWCYVEAHREREFEHAVARELGGAAQLIRSSELLTRGFFGNGTPLPELRSRIGRYALLMNDGYTIQERLYGEKELQLIGAHGGLSEDELHVPLIVAECD